MSTETTTYRTINARYDSTCFECGEAIWEGDRIDWAKNAPRGRKTRHNDCTSIARQREEGRQRVIEENARREEAQQAAIEQSVLDVEALLEMELDLDTESIWGLVEEDEAWLRYVYRNPPTMDYMTEFSRDMARTGEAKGNLFRYAAILGDRGAL